MFSGDLEALVAILGLLSKGVHCKDPRRKFCFGLLASWPGISAVLRATRVIVSGCSTGPKRHVIYRREYYKQALFVTVSLYKDFYHISLLILGFLFLPHWQKRANKK